MFDVLNGSAQDHEKEIARLHYHLCLHCQEAVARWASIKQVVSEHVKELLHPDKAYPHSPVRPVDMNSRDLQHGVQMLATDAEPRCMKVAGEM